MGDRDFIKPLLERRGKVHFGKVKMKPGKPLTFATLDLEASRSAFTVQVAVSGSPPASLPACALLTLMLHSSVS